MDTLTTVQRSACMRAVPAKNTLPEMCVRTLVHGMGFRYALHSEELPGKPDLVFVSRKKVIFVHGCFWHKHDCRHGSISPVTNAGYWESKRERNAERDKKHVRTLRNRGWKVLVVWECSTRDPISLRDKLEKFLR